jgi:membrane protease YdiL (CAAX protease family)
MLLIVWALVRRRGTTWKALGLSFNGTAIEGIRIFLLSLIVFVVGIIAYLLVPVVLAVITGVSESADFTRYEFLRDNPWGLAISLIGVYIVSSFGEEVIYRAFLIYIISEMFISNKYRVAIAVVLSAVIFGLVHYEWGTMGIIQTGMMGLAMGVCYIKFKRRLWVLILAHGYMDTLLLVQLYLVSN